MKYLIYMVIGALFVKKRLNQLRSQSYWEGISGMVHVSDAQFRFTYCSPEFMEIYGEDELTGVHVDEGYRGFVNRVLGDLSEETRERIIAQHCLGTEVAGLVQDIWMRLPKELKRVIFPFYGRKDNGSLEIFRAFSSFTFVGRYKGKPVRCSGRATPVLSEELEIIGYVVVFGEIEPINEKEFFQSVENGTILVPTTAQLLWAKQGLEFVRDVITMISKWKENHADAKKTRLFLVNPFRRETDKKLE